LFEVVDNRLSECWALTSPESASEQVSCLVIAFPEWANDLDYYERLVDADADAKAVFIERKRFMDEEHGW